MAFSSIRLSPVYRRVMGLPPRQPAPEEPVVQKRGLDALRTRTRDTTPTPQPAPTDAAPVLQLEDEGPGTAPAMVSPFRRVASALRESFLQALEDFQTGFVEPAAGVITDVSQQLGTAVGLPDIPPEQDVAGKAAQLRSEGVGPIEASRRGFVASDFPSVSVPVLPFEVPLPGGKSFQRVDVGLKGALELLPTLPVDVLLGGKPGRTALTALAKEAAVKAPSEVVSPTVSKITRILQTAGKDLKGQEAARAVERSRRVGVLAERQAAAQGQGIAGVRSARGAALKGALPKSRLSAEALEPKDLDTLVNEVLEMGASGRLAPHDVDNASEALAKLFTGDLPTRSEVTLLQKAFGQEFAGAVDAYRPFGRKALELAIDIANLPRTLKASFDLSFPLRQGIKVAARHPKEWGGIWWPQMKAFASGKFTRQIQADLATGPKAAIRDKAGLARLELEPTTVGGRVEEFIGAPALDKLARVPILGPLVRPIRAGVQASNRAFLVAGNKLRADIFDNVTAGWARAGRTFETHPGEYISYARWLNRATGRGGLGPLEDHAGLLAAGFWSPRFTISQFTAPLEVLSGAAGKHARFQIAQDLVAWVGSGVLALTILANAPGVDVEADPRSSDFGKIRVGNIRLDFWGGSQQIARYAAQLLRGERKTVGENPEIVGIDRKETLGSFIRSKLNPALGVGVSAATGTTFTGEEATAQRLLIEATVPLFEADLAEAFLIDGVKGAIVAIPGVGGAGVTAFEPLRSLRQEITDDLFPGKVYQSTDPLNADRVLTGAEKRKVNANKRIEQRLQEFGERPPSVEGRDRLDVLVTNAVERSRAIRNIEDNQLRGLILSGARGEDLRKGVQRYKERLFYTADTLFSPEVEGALKGTSITAAWDEFAREYWDAPLEDSATGVLDYRRRDAIRAQVLRDAKVAGVPDGFITNRGPDNFRKPLDGSPEVVAVLEQYEQDMETLRPYWSASNETKIGRRQRELLLRTSPAIRAAKDRWYPSSARRIPG